MKTIMAKIVQDFPSKRHFHWTTKVSNEEQEKDPNSDVKAEDPKISAMSRKANKEFVSATNKRMSNSLQAIAVCRLKSVMTKIGRSRLSIGTRLVGTLFGERRGHVHFAFQRDSSSEPVLLIELAMQISGLVQEMASGLVRIALECDKKEEDEKKKKTCRLIDEGVWRTYCNGKKCGVAKSRECGAKEREILKCVEAVSMGAGVLPIGGEIMYMRAKFERVFGSADSEAFYMMNPDSNAAPELSLYLLRV